MLDQFMPHGYCFQFVAEILWPMVTGDAMTAISYFSMPFALGWLAFKRPDLPFRPFFILFAIFILSCGIGHILDIYNVWNKEYKLAAYQRLFTGIVSLVTAAGLWPVVRLALKIPSPEMLRQANEKLANEVRIKKTLETTVEQLKKTIRELEGKA